ncbi:ROK family transcriptional regulator [Paractinoplanes lichenicola]|uniref:ROK family transcriptional regulator n=1 Tax=Paractinoplanes lichenicola TaxID=2802976 RepID=A0ABS1VTE8_9ACTN|nr:ROK family transcriptional regulator [Actinoplanes lichenicola]MBL7257728.1 ROK family transcriptional regulator [Actinoplanes lichenicola]
MDPARPSQEILRTLTDEHVLRALMRHRLLTRAELSTETGISKPTAGESVRRLTEAGLVVDTGRRTPGGRGKGRVGTYYSLAPGIGTALAVSIAPEGVVAEHIDAYGDLIARAEAAVGRPARPDDVAQALAEAVDEVCGHGFAGRGDGSVGSGAGAATASWSADHAVRPRLAVVSAADPVDRHSGRLLQLPDAPFLLGEIDPVAVLAGRVDGLVHVDNDVNWAAEAERKADPLDDFAYVYLDEGLGCAIVSDGEVRRGHHGLAGEVAHLITVGPGGVAMPLIEVFGLLGLRRAGGATAIDVDLLLEKRPPEVVSAVGGLIAALGTLIDPEVIVIGGRWGIGLVDDIAQEAARLPRNVQVRAAAVDNEPSLSGARADALDRVRELILSR